MLTLYKAATNRAESLVLANPAALALVPRSDKNRAQASGRRIAGTNTAAAAAARRW